MNLASNIFNCHLVHFLLAKYKGKMFVWQWRKVSIWYLFSHCIAFVWNPFPFGACHPHYLHTIYGNAATLVISKALRDNHTIVVNNLSCSGDRHLF